MDAMGGLLRVRGCIPCASRDDRAAAPSIRLIGRCGLRPSCTYCPPIELLPVFWFSLKDRLWHMQCTVSGQEEMVMRVFYRLVMYTRLSRCAALSTSAAHASMAGEHITALGGHPSLKIGKLIESHKHDIIQILQESLDHEHATLREYYNLLELVLNKSVWLEEYAREQIQLEEQHIAEVEKMMRKPGELHPAG